MENKYSEPLAEGDYSLCLKSAEVIDGKFGESYLFKGEIAEDVGNTFVLWISKPSVFTYGTDLGKLFRATGRKIPKGDFDDAKVFKSFAGALVPISLTYNDGSNARCRLRS